MPKTTIISAACVLAAAGTFWVVLHLAVNPTFDQVANSLVLTTAIPATLFVALYATTTAWWRTMIGRALLTSSFGLAALLNISLAARWFEFVMPEWGLIAVLTVIFCGAWLKLAALLGQKWAAHRERRQDRG